MNQKGVFKGATNLARSAAKFFGVVQKTLFRDGKEKELEPKLKNCAKAEFEQEVKTDHDMLQAHNKIN